MRAALYLRVSTTDQDVGRQERELRAVATARGYTIADGAVYCDHSISGSKGRDKRPAFDQLHKDAVRHRFDIVMAWSVDRLSRSMPDLVDFLQQLHALHIDLFLYQQAVDTTTPMGRAMFQIAGVFAELERPSRQTRMFLALDTRHKMAIKSVKDKGPTDLSPSA
jgi:DNA invertase Pin-like site-specific DNA recombinase